MTCPTCDHTMEGIDDKAARRVFLCPRCGTVKIETYTGNPDAWEVNIYVPKLVDRCRQFEVKFFPKGSRTSGSRHYSGELQGVWRRLGIAESIRPPADRPKESP